MKYEYTLLRPFHFLLHSVSLIFAQYAGFSAIHSHHILDEIEANGVYTIFVWCYESSAVPVRE